MNEKVLVSGQLIHMRVWSKEDGTILAQKDDLESWVTNVCVCECNKTGKTFEFYTGHRDGKICLWTFDDQDLLVCRWTVQGHTSEILKLSSHNGQLWSMSSWKLTNLDENALANWNVVSVRQMGVSHFSNRMSAYFDGWGKFAKQIVTMPFNTYQLGCFVIKKRQNLSKFQRIAAGLQMLGLDWIPATYFLVFVASLVAQCSFVVLMYAQEKVEWKQFLNSNSKFWHYAWLFCNVMVGIMAGPMVLPVFKYLMEALMCTSEGRLIAQESVECWTKFHIGVMVVPSLIIMVVSLQIIYRLGTCDNQLSLIDMRANPFDSSADMPLGENRPRNHKLVVRSTHYDNVLLLVKMVCTSSTVYFANQNFASVVYIFAACALLFADFSVDMYWDVALRGMNPSCLQAGFDFGLLWLYLVTLAADLALEGAQSTARTIFFLVSIPPSWSGWLPSEKEVLGEPTVRKAFEACQCQDAISEVR